MARLQSFQLYLLINYQSLHDYPYIALSDESDVAISICDEHIYITKRCDLAFFSLDDYIATSRTIEVDIGYIFHLIEVYVGTEDAP